MVKQLELTSDQTAKIDAHVAEFQAAQQAWMQENGTKAKALEAKSREEKKNGDLSEATKKELAELNATRPSPPQVQEKITALLTVEQKAALETKLAEARAAAQEKKNEQARKRRDAERGNGKSDVGTGGGSGREGGKGRTGK
ncbi:MAG: hypothetical protein JNL80_03300 [Phycisphaerae bacterium]|nr:hypothetical protein [Phycisphaerae bacterium]